MYNAQLKFRYPMIEKKCTFYRYMLFEKKKSLNTWGHICVTQMGCSFHNYWPGPRQRVKTVKTKDNEIDVPWVCMGGQKLTKEYATLCQSRSNQYYFGRIDKTYQSQCKAPVGGKGFGLLLLELFSCLFQLDVTQVEVAPDPLQIHPSAERHL